MSPLKRVQIQTRRGLVVAGLIAALALPVAAWIVGGRVSRNCTGIHRIVKVGHEIIAQGRANADQYYRDGLLNKAQRDRAAADVTRQLRVWDSADCPR